MQFGDFFQFHKFLAPVLIKIIYWVGLFFIVLTTLLGVTGMSLMDRMIGGYNSGFNLAGALLALVLGAVYALVWRVVCEIWIVMFSINDRLGILSGELPRKDNLIPPAA